MSWYVVNLGHCDHEVVQNLGYNEKKKKKKVIRVDSLDLKRTNFKILRELVSCDLWESYLGVLGVFENWPFFKNYLLKAQEQATLLRCKSSKHGRRLFCLNRELLKEIKQKIKCTMSLSKVRLHRENTEL